MEKMVAKGFRINNDNIDVNKANLPLKTPQSGFHEVLKS